MTSPHRIRLQAAWDATPDGSGWTRSFGRPAGVGPADRVWLVFERPAAWTATLNGRSLPASGAGADEWRCEVTAALRERNQLRLTCGAAKDARGVGAREPLPDRLGVVFLEIEARG